MKILIACEFSGVVRDEFIAKGHEAMSCDLLPTEKPGPHYQGDVLNIINDGWDMMICFPPCTHLAVSGARWFKEKLVEQKLALEFINRLLTVHIDKICLENPVGIISTHIQKPTQIIQPYEFGHNASKKTCLWLKNLPKLISTQYVEPMIINGKPRWGNQTPSGQNKLGPSENRWKERSRTYEGIANAMAEQWG